MSYLGRQYSYPNVSTYAYLPDTSSVDVNLEGDCFVRVFVELRDESSTSDSEVSSAKCIPVTLHR